MRHTMVMRVYPPSPSGRKHAGRSLNRRSLRRVYQYPLRVVLVPFNEEAAKIRKVFHPGEMTLAQPLAIVETSAKYFHIILPSFLSLCRPAPARM